MVPECLFFGTNVMLFCNFFWDCPEWVSIYWLTWHSCQEEFQLRVMSCKNISTDSSTYCTLKILSKNTYSNVGQRILKLVHDMTSLSNTYWQITMRNDKNLNTGFLQDITHFFRWTSHYISLLFPTGNGCACKRIMSVTTFFPMDESQG